MNSLVWGNDRMYLATFGVASGERSEFGHEMWIGQKPDIEQQVRVLGHSCLKPKLTQETMRFLSDSCF